MSLALAGGFLTTGPPGKSLQNCFNHAKLKSVPIKDQVPTSLLPWPLTPTILLSVSEFGSSRYFE